MALNGLFDRLFPDAWEGVGGLGRIFLTAIDAKPNQSTWTSESTRAEPAQGGGRGAGLQGGDGWQSAARPHQEWPGAGPGQGDGQRPYRAWPGR
jgi:hypothetical protein